MPEPQIIDTSVITVKSTTKDTYGNLVVTPTDGKDIKVAAKRDNLFEFFQQGRAVKLFWAEYQHHKYVANAELFDGKPPAEKQVEPLMAGISPEAPQAINKPIEPQVSNISGVERGLWWKELGECFRAGLIKKDEGLGKSLWQAYLAQMFSVLPIKIEKGG